MAQGRANYVAVEDKAALEAFQTLAKSEGIIPAFESAHAVAHALILAEEAEAKGEERIILVNLSGRGDKDMAQARELLK